MRIAIDIDSTLHPYWDQLAAVAERRYGVTLSYEDQDTWHIDRLEPEQLAACVAETHGAEFVLAAEPYPGAVETIAGWHAAGHFIQISSHRRESARDATARWLEAIGLPHHELWCSFDKIARCLELDIDVLIDDSPVNLARAAEHGIVPATLEHPWNRELRRRGEVVSAPDWPRLAAELAPVLDGGDRGRPGRRERGGAQT